MNLGVTWDVAAHVPELAEALRPRWVAAYVEFRAVRQRYRETWGGLYDRLLEDDSQAGHRGDDRNWCTYTEVVDRYLASCRETGRGSRVPDDAWGWLRASGAVRQRLLRISGPRPSRMVVMSALTDGHPRHAAIGPELLEALEEVGFRREDVERLLPLSTALLVAPVERPADGAPGPTGRRGVGGAPGSTPAQARRGVRRPAARRAWAGGAARARAPRRAGHAGGPARAPGPAPHHGAALPAALAHRPPRIPQGRRLSCRQSAAYAARPRR